MAGTTYKGLVIQFGADTTALSKALKGIQGEARDTQADLKQINAALKFNPGNTELLQQKTRKLAEAIEQTEKKLKACKDAQEQLDAKRKSGVELTKEEQDQYDKLTRDILKCENQLDRYGKELADTQREAKASETALYKLGQTIENNSDKLTKAGEGMQKVGSALSKGVTAPIVAAGSASVKMAADFESSFAKLLTIADTTSEAGVSVDDLKTRIENLSVQTGMSMGEISEAAYSAISAGQDTADALTFVEQSARLAKGGFTDVSTATDVLTTALNAYGLSADEATRVSDVLIETQNQGKTTVDELASSMGKVIPTASAANVGIEDLSSQYVALTKNGISTAESTTYINSMLDELTKSGSKAFKAFEAASGQTFPDYIAAGHSTAEAMQLLAKHEEEAGLKVTDAFGSAEAGKAANVLVSHTNDAIDAMETMKTKSGQTGEAFDKMNETTAARFERMKATAEAFAITVGDEILPVIQPVLEGVTGMIKTLSGAFHSLDDDQKAIVLAVAGVAAAIGPLLVGAGKLLIFIGSLGPALTGAATTFTAFSGILAANPFIPVIVGITAVVAALAFFFTQTEIGRELWAKFTGFLGSAFEAVSTFLGEKIEGVKAFFEGLWAKAGEMRDNTAAAFDNLKERAGTAFEGIKQTVTDKLNFAKKQAGLAGGAIRDVLSGDFASAASKASEMFGNIQRNIREKLQAARQNVENVGNAIGNVLGFPGLGTKVAGVFEGARKTIIDKLQGAFDAVKDIPGSLARIFSGMNLNLPRFALPHFWVNGGSFPWGIGGQGQPPQFGVDWYARGAIFTKPTIFPGTNGAIGVGDVPKGEAVLPIERLQTMIDSALARYGGNTVVNVSVNARIGSNLDAYQVGQQIGRGAESVMKQRGYAT